MTDEENKSENTQNTSEGTSGIFGQTVNDSDPDGKKYRELMAESAQGKNMRARALKQRHPKNI